MVLHRCAYLVIVSLLLGTGAGPASAASLSSTRGERQTATRTAVVTLPQIAANDSPDTEMEVVEPGTPPSTMPVLPGTPVIDAVESDAASPEPAGTEPSAPTLGASFQALPDNNTSIPPDTHGAVGPDHLMTTLNTQVRVQTRSGATVSTVSLDGFWSALGGPDAFDPKILYDQYSGRWMFTATANARSASSAVLIGVTATDDPTGTWYLSSFDADAGDATWADYPSFGFNGKWIVISLNMFTHAGSFSSTKLWVIDKQGAYAGASATATVFTPGSICGGSCGGTIVPAVTQSATLGTMHLLQNWNGNSGGRGYIRRYEITGSVGAESMATGGLISVAAPWDSFPPSGADFAPQAGTSVRMQNNDARMQHLVWRNSSLWAVQTVFLPAGGSPTRSAVQWWQISDSTFSVTQRGRIEDTSTGRFYAFPSIAVNQHDEVLIGYSRFSAAQYASANWSFRAAGDPANTMQADTVLKAGEGIYHKTFSGTRNRWGDYSNTVVDPLNDTNFWTIQEYAATPSGTGNGSGRWGTWWGQLAPAGIPAFSHSPSSLAFGSVLVGSQSGSSSVTVTSTGTGDLTISSATVGGTHPGDFAETSDGCSGGTFSPGASCTVSVRFAPTSAGARSATLNISTDAGSATVALSGTGTAPDVSVTPSSLSFASATSVTTSPKTVTVKSTGTAPLDVGIPGVSGANAADFSASGCSGVTLAPGASCAISVTFTPGAGATARSASLEVPTTAGTRTVTLTGAVDSAPPSSSFTTSPGAVLVHTRDLVRGITTDDGAIVNVIVTFTPVIGSPVVTGANLSCSVPGSCTWAANLPLIPGTYSVNARATDAAGRVESPGPTISVLVL